MTTTDADYIYEKEMERFEIWFSSTGTDLWEEYIKDDIFMILEEDKIAEWFREYNTKGDEYEIDDVEKFYELYSDEIDDVLLDLKEWWEGYKNFCKQHWEDNYN